MGNIRLEVYDDVTGYVWLQINLRKAFTGDSLVANGTCEIYGKEHWFIAVATPRHDAPQTLTNALGTIQTVGMVPMDGRNSRTRGE